MRMNILRIKAENQLKESQAHDLKIQILHLDLELKKKQLTFLTENQSNESWARDLKIQALRLDIECKKTESKILDSKW